MTTAGSSSTAAPRTTSSADFSPPATTGSRPPAPDRALAGQALAAAILALAVAAVSGLAVLGHGDGSQLDDTLTVVPLMALFGVANATIIRRTIWIFAGYAGWIVLVEGLIGKLERPLPFSSFLSAGGGDTRGLATFAGWTALALILAIVTIRRDLTAD
jgi:hypothetical protein